VVDREKQASVVDREKQAMVADLGQLLLLLRAHLCCLTAPPHQDSKLYLLIAHVVSINSSPLATASSGAEIV
jgi:hypothetical protein